MSFKILNIRWLHTTLPCLLRHPTRRSNPGAAYQLKTLESCEDIEHDFADLESDFMHVHKSHRQHEREIQQHREKTRLWVVKQKYFKEKMPNFLTYAEKQQIKLLHARDSQEWTADKLADSFPASPVMMRKILRTDWLPRSVKRVRQHDEAVIRNWEMFRSGAFAELPLSLKEHLQKFTDRTSQDLMQTSHDKQEWQPRPDLTRPKDQEFLSIITSCKRYAYQSPKKVVATPLLKSRKEKVASAPQLDDEDSYLLDKVRDKRRMRLQELKEFKLNSTELSLSQNMECRSTADNTLEQRAIEVFGSPSATGILPKLKDTAVVELTANDCSWNSNLVEKFQSNEIVITSEDCKRFEMTTVKDRVYIPRKLWRAGATYKIEDCYYDDDGEFLYRVPGMTGKMQQ